MKKGIQRIFQISILIGLLAFLASKWIRGELSFYINMRFSPLTMIAILGLALTVAAGIWGLRRLIQLKMQMAENGGEDLNLLPASTIIILAIPLLLGVLVPQRPLTTQALDTRGMSFAAPASLTQNSTKVLEVAPDDRTVLDWIKIFNYEPDVTPYLKQTASVIGFVYHDPRLGGSQFMVGRFAITCCVADAFAIGMAVDWPNSAALQENTWVNVKGPVEIITIEGRKVPLIRAETVKSVAAPKEPYLYP
jgi:putative membrane protein